ncbi:GNAT family N-acetyltransferase [Micromonospora avicenniae]|uniref:Protein N-acetyltransferase, RimJ/RimL family n=1 Tax=Micromonospora avicenniae TaxID=1198245 RepID=A0A1N6X7B2_9ACTN|nr:GNAT family N-acetyltransferase [Micromonospora avicenniae]SIQ98157.1 Protein N-acetyltransferase, RimJ/RimL family [Micromonospora avicenniae]
MQLTAPGLVLRPWLEADAPAVQTALSDPDIARWNPQGWPVDEERTLSWLRSRADWSAGDHASLAVADATDGTLLGSVSLHHIHGDEAEIGYWIVPAARGRGVASRAVTLLTRWGFGQLELHRIQLLHATANPASCRVAVRTGYRLEGTLRESFRYGDGRRHDEHLHARLATDPWPGE